MYPYCFRLLPLHVTKRVRFCMTGKFQPLIVAGECILPSVSVSPGQRVEDWEDNVRRERD